LELVSTKFTNVVLHCSCRCLRIIFTLLCLICAVEPSRFFLYPQKFGVAALIVDFLFQPFYFKAYLFRNKTVWFKDFNIAIAFSSVDLLLAKFRILIFISRELQGIKFLYCLGNKIRVPTGFVHSTMNRFFITFSVCLTDSIFFDSSIFHF
jgi:hypothetical protein